MGLRSDKWIIEKCSAEALIHPFSETQVTVNDTTEARVLSWGPSSYGYDCRLDKSEFKIFSPVACFEIDPKAFDPASLADTPLRTAADGSQYWLLPANAYALGITIEKFNIPRNVTGIALAKSSFARSGVFCNTTPLEAGWSGRLVVEIYNAANLPVRVYAEEGFLQVLFFESDEPCSVSYNERNKGRGGKYQGQKKLTLAKLK